MSLDWILLGLRLLAVIILYAFLGVAFYVIWRDLQQAATPQPETTTYYLRVVAAPTGSSLVAGDVLPLWSITLLGRAGDSTILLDDTAASAQHARLSRVNGVWWLEDLGSRNGTLLNDLPLAKPASLADGDVIGIGNLRLRLETT